MSIIRLIGGAERASLSGKFKLKIGRYETGIF